MKRQWLLVAVLAVIAAVVVVLWWLFSRGDTPAAVSTEAGLAQLQEDLAAQDDRGDVTARGADNDAGDGTDGADGATASPGVDTRPINDDQPQSDETDETDETSEATAGETAPSSGVNGTWVVDDEFGDFDFDTASGSFAGFRVAEELTIGNVTAVGRTGDVTGSFTIDDGVLVDAEVIVDMTTIVSNDSRREHAIDNAVRSSLYPTATFVLTDPVELDAEALESGETLEVDLFGDLTVSGSTNRVPFHLHPTIVETDLGLVVGSAEIFWSDFGVTPPSAPIVVSVANRGVVEFQLVVRRV